MYWFPYLSLPINLIKALIENRNLRQLGVSIIELILGASFGLFF
ncbi:hypothetical protein [Cytobacillus oceanisediminis]|nr:hypothetical protein [Cytobacillus oceanisediminis]